MRIDFAPDAKAVDLTRISHSFPFLEDLQIQRENFLQTLETLASGQVDLVIVEGEEGLGKTTLLAQFAQRHSDRCLSAFLRPTSQWSYDPHMVRWDLCNQLNWLVKEEELEEPGEATRDVLGAGYMTLQRRASRRNERYFVVIDGLDEIPAADDQSRSSIIELLPLGLPGFFCLIGGSSESLPSISPRVRRKTLMLAGFTLDEAHQFFRGITDDEERIREVYKVCRGVPAHLASVKRMLKAGVELAYLIREMPSHLPGLFELEWRRVDQRDDQELLLLALVACAGKSRSVAELAVILGMAEVWVQSIIEKFGFIEAVPEGGAVRYVSESFRRFAERELSSHVQAAHEKIISYLFLEPESGDALAHLPEHLERAGKLDELVNYLSPENVIALLEKTQSLSLTRNKAQSGLKASLALKRHGDLMRFALQQSLLLETGDVLRSEVEAYMALKDYDAALALAQTARLKEDRLHLLCIIGKIRHVHGARVEPDLLEQIRSLYEEVDIASLGDKAVGIAADMLLVLPDLAVEVVEAATATSDRENALDWALASLSVMAVGASKSWGATSARHIQEKLGSGIKDPSAQRMQAFLSLKVGGYSASEVIDLVGATERISDRLRLLQRWVLANRTRSDASKVIEHALALAISSTVYTPSARFFCDLSEALFFVEDRDLLVRLLRTMDGQRGNIEHLGSTEDYYVWQVNMARAETLVDVDAADHRFLEVYFSVIDIGDLHIKSNCLASLVSALSRLGEGGSLGSVGLYAEARGNLVEAIGELLAKSALHLRAVSRVLSFLAPADWRMAVDIASNLNREGRRDRALVEIVGSMLAEESLGAIDFVGIREAVSMVKDKSQRDDLVVSVVSRLQEEESLSAERLSPAMSLLRDVENLDSLRLRCEGCCRALDVLSKVGEDGLGGLRQHLEAVLANSWQSIDSGWVRVDVGLEVVRYLAESSLETARHYLRLTGDLRRSVWLSSYSESEIYVLCVRLAIRAFVGLLPRHLDAEADLDRISRLIEALPSSRERAELWSRVALCFYLHGRSEESKRIVTSFVWPLVRSIDGRDTKTRSEALIAVGPSLYVSHRKTALDEFRKLSLRARERAVNVVINFIFKKVPPDEPFEARPFHVFDISHEEIVDICELLEELETDDGIALVVQRICDALGAKKSKVKFSKEQVSDVLGRLEEIIQRKLPDNRNIAHAGFRIAALGKIAKVRKASVEFVEGLVASAMSIPNLADRALVLTIVMPALWQRSVDKGRALLAVAEKTIEDLPLVLDRIDRYGELATELLQDDVQLSKVYLKKAMGYALIRDEPELLSARRRIIDQAHAIDPNLASALISLMDDDPARLEARNSMKRRLALHETKRRLARADAEFKPDEHLSKASWSLLGSLNAGRVAPLPMGRVRELIYMTRGLPLLDAYPVLAWTTESLVRLYSRTNESREYLRPMFEAVVLGSEVARQVIGGAAKTNAVKVSALGGGNHSVMIRSGERTKALDYIRDWIRSNANGRLKICDAYFGPSDLDVLKLVLEQAPSCAVRVLTSRRHQEKEQPARSWEEVYRAQWRALSVQDPPDTEIVIVGVGSGGALPIHDRWWITVGSGLRIGTSFGALGRHRDSEISLLSRDEAELRESEIDQYLERSRRIHQGDRITYTLFNL